MTIITDDTTTGTLPLVRDSVQAKGYSLDTAPAVQNSMINSIYRRIIGERRWWFLRYPDNQSLTTTPGDPEVPLFIDGLLHIDAIRLSSGSERYEVDYADPQDLRTAEHLDDATGPPEFWSRFGSIVRLYPTPDKAYTVHTDYVIDPDDLVNDSDVSVIPLAYLDVLVWGAIKDLTFRERDMDGYSVASNEYETILRAMRHQDGLVQRQSPSTVTKTGAIEAVNLDYR